MEKEVWRMDRPKTKTFCGEFVASIIIKSSSASLIPWFRSGHRLDSGFGSKDELSGPESTCGLKIPLVL